MLLFTSKIIDMKKTIYPKRQTGIYWLTVLMLFFTVQPLLKGQTSENEPGVGQDETLSVKILSVSEVYTDETVNDGDTVLVFGYYTNPDQAAIIDFPIDFMNLSAWPPHSVVKYTGDSPSVEYWNGGFVAAHGTVNFTGNPNPLWPEDSLEAVISILGWLELYEKLSIPEQEKEQNGDSDHGRSYIKEDCDECKFAIFIGGGYSSRPEGHFDAMWDAIEDLYRLKRDSLDYCEENIFVNYWDGSSDNTDEIPDGRVNPADSVSIASAHEEISRRVAECNRNGKQASFQKMIISHGTDDGAFVLHDNTVLEYSDLKQMQQAVIDSCATTVTDEFLQCFGGSAVDEISGMDTKDKATIYANSASPADDLTWVNPGTTPSYLAGKIEALASGMTYPEAVVEGKRSYDDWLENTAIPAQDDLVDRLEDALQDLIDNDVYFGEPLLDFMASLDPPIHPAWLPEVRQLLIDDLNERINRARENLESMRNGVCKSMNVTKVPFANYCEWVEFVVPPGGQLVLDLESDTVSCGSVTVYRENELTGVTEKVAEWNNNIPGSEGYQEGYNRRVINGNDAMPTRFIVHNDARGRFVVTAEARANQDLEESQSNPDEKAGFSFGGRDGSSKYYSQDLNGFYFIDNIDQIPISLSQLPARMGGGHVIDFGFTFSVNPEDVYWTEMELVIDVAEVHSPGNLSLFSEMNPDLPEIYIEESGRYTAYIGDMTGGGEPDVQSSVAAKSIIGQLFMVVTADSGLDFSFDSWGLRTLLSQPLNPVEFLVVTQEGDPVPGANLEIDGEFTLIADMEGFAYTYLLAGNYVVEIFKDGYFAVTEDITVAEGDNSFVFTLLCEPIQPIGLAAHEVTSTSALIDWIPAGEENNWDIIYGERGFDYDTDGILTEGIGHHPYLLSNLDPQTEYDVYVRAVCGNQTGEWAGPLEFSTNAQTWVIVAVSNNEAFGTVTGSGNYEHFEEVTLTATPSTGYHFSEWTEDGEVVMDGGEPEGEVYSFAAESDRSLVAHFALTTFVVTFTVEDSFENFIDDAVITFGGETNNQGNYVFENIEPGEYSYLVEAEYFHDFQGETTVVDSDITVNVVMETDDTGVFDSAVTEFSVYPNPAYELLHVEFLNNSNESVNISVLNVLGQEVRSQLVDGRGRQGVQFNMQGFTPGIYMIKVGHKAGYLLEKIIVR